MMRDALPPVPAPPPGAPPMPGVDQAMGRYGAIAPPKDPSPDAEARRAYMEAQSAGADPLIAAQDAWKGAIGQMTTRYAQPGFQPADAGEANLSKVAKFLQEKERLDPVTAFAMAHEYLVAQGGQPQQSPQPAQGVR